MKSFMGYDITEKTKRRINNDDPRKLFKSLNELKKGSLFGEVGLVTNLKRTATIYSMSK